MQSSRRRSLTGLQFPRSRAKTTASATTAIFSFARAVTIPVSLDFGIVRRLSALTTHRAGIPTSGPRGTSTGMPRMGVLVSRSVRAPFFDTSCSDPVQGKAFAQAFRCGTSCLRMLCPYGRRAAPTDPLLAAPGSDSSLTTETTVSRRTGTADSVADSHRVYAILCTLPR